MARPSGRLDPKLSPKRALASLPLRKGEEQSPDDPHLAGRVPQSEGLPAGSVTQQPGAPWRQAAEETPHGRRQQVNRGRGALGKRYTAESEHGEKRRQA